MNILNENVTVPELGRTFGTGWLPPLPDLRDYTADHPELAPLIMKLGITPGQPSRAPLPPKADLRQWCSPVEDQGYLGSCSAHATVGVIEYYQCRTQGKYTEGSRLFVYKITRNLMGVTGDTGAWLRTAIASVILCGIPPEKYWPYTDAHTPGPGQERYFDSEPSSFVYAVADNFKAIKYFSHDPFGQNANTKTVLTSVKTYVARGIPAMFGFFGFPSFSFGDIPGGIPYPGPTEQTVWGHAVVAVGYDDTKKITNTQTNQKTTGALLIRNSWTANWGDHGYGWLPYDYILNKLALDFWSMLSMEILNMGEFGLDNN